MCAATKQSTRDAPKQESDNNSRRTPYECYYLIKAGLFASPRVTTPNGSYSHLLTVDETCHNEAGMLNMQMSVAAQRGRDVSRHHTLAGQVVDVGPA